MNKKIITILFLSILGSTAIAEEIRYVSDRLIITIRSGPSIQNKIVRKIESGARLEVFDRSDDGKYAQIRTQNGVEGWVLSQYITDKPIAKHRLRKTEKNLERAQKKASQLETKVNELNNQIKELKAENASLNKNSREMKNKITTISKAASRPIELDSENKALRESLGKISTELQVVSNQYQKLKDNDQQEWFIIGAGVLLAGILLGFLIPKLRLTRKDSWGSL